MNVRYKESPTIRLTEYSTQSQDPRNGRAWIYTMRTAYIVLIQCFEHGDREAACVKPLILTF